VIEGRELRLISYRVLDGASRHAEMRRAPYDAPVANEQRLGGLMAHSQARGDRIRYGAMGLHGDHRVLRSGRPLIEVCDELIQRVHARPACIAVLEQQKRARLRFVNEPVELLDVVERGQIRMHLLQCSSPLLTARPTSARFCAPFLHFLAGMNPTTTSFANRRDELLRLLQRNMRRDWSHVRVGDALRFEHVRYTELPDAGVVKLADARDSKSPLCDSCPFRNSSKEIDPEGDPPKSE